MWYWRPTKNNYPWCWRQAELNWKPWQHSACLSNPLALPESRQIPAQALAYSTPAQKKTFPNCRYENTPGRNSFDGLLFFYSISISHTTTDKQAWLLFPYTVFLIVLIHLLQCGDSRFSSFQTKEIRKPLCWWFQLLTCVLFSCRCFANVISASKISAG